MSSRPLSRDRIGRPVADLHRSPQALGVAGRARACELAAVDREAALKIARAIQHPWYRCQALTSVVVAGTWHAGSRTLLAEALGAACRLAEPNRVASVSAGRLRLLAMLDPAARLHVGRLLDLIAREPHGLRRLDGVCAIFMAAVPVARLRQIAWPALLTAASQSTGWRTERLVDVVAWVLFEHDRPACVQLLQSRPVSRFTRRSRALLQRMEAA